jgi:hypothetical protein
MRPVSTETLDLRDEGLTRSDLWVFAPLIAIVVVLPIVVVILMSASLYRLATHYDATMPPPLRQHTAFVDRWPNEQTVHILR